MRVIVLGGLGLIGSGVMSVLTQNKNIDLFSTYSKSLHPKPKKLLKINYSFVNFEDKDSINNIFDLKPNIIINCVGITKHISSHLNKKNIYLLNSDLPKYLDKESKKRNFSLIHISTDCVYSGSRGNYTEDDKTDALDLYGHSKAIGEELNNSLILRTSTIGREIETQHGLLEWFLSQKTTCEGYRNAFFSGITNIELGLIIHDIIIPRIKDVKGIYNISSEKINKYELLKIFSKFYNKRIEIKKNFDFKIDRSLNSNKFKVEFNYVTKDWNKMLNQLDNHNTL